MSQRFVKIEWASCSVLILVDALKGRVKLMGKSDPVISLCSGVTLYPWSHLEKGYLEKWFQRLD